MERADSLDLPPPPEREETAPGLSETPRTPPVGEPAAPIAAEEGVVVPQRDATSPESRATPAQEPSTAPAPLPMAASAPSRASRDETILSVPPSAAMPSEDASQPLLGQSNAGDATEAQQHWADLLNKVFMYLAIVVGIAAGIAAIVLYSLHDVQAVTVSHAIAGLCAFTCVVLTGLQVALHLSVYTNPDQQRLIVRIILMCPIYAVDSFVGLVAYRYASVVNLVRDSYESYVIYMFFNLLLSYLGGEEQIVQNWKDSKPDMEHLPPLCCLPHVKLNQRTLTWWKFFLLQYTVINPLMTLVAIPLYFTDRWDEGAFSATSAYAWFSAVKFVSVSFAFTSLVYFFFGTKEFYGEGVKPMPKFAAIKAVVFVSFWQTVLLAGLNHFGVIPHSDRWTADQVATGLGNFVLCIEMFLIAIAHRWVFTDEPYHSAAGRQSLSPEVISHVFAVTDVLQDAKNIVRQMTPLGGDGPHKYQSSA